MTDSCEKHPALHWQGGHHPIDAAVLSPKFKDHAVDEFHNFHPDFVHALADTSADRHPPVAVYTTNPGHILPYSWKQRLSADNC